MAVKPALVLLPGLLNDHRLWSHQITALQDCCSTIVPDLTNGSSIADLAAQVLATSPDRFALCALSMGGYVALEIMRQAPARVIGLILMDTSARPDTPEQHKRRADLVRLAGMGRFMGVTPRLLPMLVAARNVQDASITEPIMAMARDMGKEVYIRQQTAIMQRLDSRPFLTGIFCPTLIAVGEEDQLTPVAIAREMADLIPCAELSIVKESGHLPPLEQPDETLWLIRSFLKKHSILNSSVTDT